MMRRREERLRMMRLMLGAITFSLTVMGAVGAAVLYLQPPTEQEKKCLNMVAIDAIQCAWDARNAKK